MSQCGEDCPSAAETAPLAILAVCLGLYPECVLSYLHVPVSELLKAGVRQ